MRPTKAVSRAFVLLFAAALVACTGSKPERQSQSDPSTDIAAWSTFGWQAAAGAGIGDEPMRMLDANIRNAIETELTKRGYTKAEANPQFLVSYETAAQEKVKSNPFRIGIGMGSFGGNVGGSVGVSSPSVQSYREGRLVIHAIDAAANREVWYGSIAGSVDRSQLDAAAVSQVVAAAMETFPAKQGAAAP